MKVTPLALPEVLLIEPRVFGDERGFFYESWNRRAFADAGIDVDFVQDNHSRSRRGVLRGLHYQIEHAQGKLVRATVGEVYDVVVDLRRSSPNFGRSLGIGLSAADKRMLWIPPGFAHGFLVVSDDAEFLYKTTDFWYPEHERTLLWNDPALGIEWPLRRRADRRGEGRRRRAARFGGHVREMTTCALAPSATAPGGSACSGSGRRGAALRENPGPARRTGRPRARARCCPRTARSSRSIAPTLDLREPDAIVVAMRDTKPDLIVNAGAYTAVDLAERERDAAFAVNARAPQVLAEEAKRTGALLVHYSTDYVFDGAATSPYDEDAPTGPLNVYGQSKLEGEHAIAASGAARARAAHELGVRPYGQELLPHHPRLARERDELRIVADQAGTPNWSRTLAEATAALVAQGLVAARRALGSLSLHLHGPTTWHGFAPPSSAMRARRAWCRSRPPTTPRPRAGRPTACSHTSRFRAHFRLRAARVAGRAGRLSGGGARRGPRD